MTSYTIRTNTPAETQAVGRTLGRILTNHPGLVVALSGELGAGKTTLTQGIAQGMGITESVTSPTFTLVNEYTIPQTYRASPQRLIHIDSYRLGEVESDAELEAATFGFEEMVDAADEAKNVVIIEWAERLQALLPADYLHISLRYVDGDETARAILLQSSGSISKALVEHMCMVSQH